MVYRTAQREFCCQYVDVALNVVNCVVNMHLYHYVCNYHCNLCISHYRDDHVTV